MKTTMIYFEQNASLIYYFISFVIMYILHLI